MRSVAFITNKYYHDNGTEYVFRRLKEEFSRRDIALCAVTDVYASYPQTELLYDFAVFWDKDIPLAKSLERTGLRLFNSARAVELCDDKEKTFAALADVIDLPATIVAPLVYPVNDGADGKFLDKVEAQLGYPVIVKECVGSLGQQVYLAKDRRELEKCNERLRRIPHIYQRFVAGERMASDIRVYIVGGAAVGVAERTNTTDFRSNTACGGELTLATLSDELRAQAERAAQALTLSYGSCDFICEQGKYVFIEANSSAYMQRAENLGIPLASLYAQYMTEAMYGSR